MDVDILGGEEYYVPNTSDTHHHSLTLRPESGNNVRIRRGRFK